MREGPKAGEDRTSTAVSRAGTFPGRTLKHYFSQRSETTERDLYGALTIQRAPSLKVYKLSVSFRF